jgi:hypothetical protein
MLKKVVHISLIVVLLVSTTGVTVYKHYCGNSLVSKSIGIPTKNCCYKGCNKCKNELSFLKVTDNFQLENSLQAFKIWSKQLFHAFHLVPVSLILFSEHLFSGLFFYRVKTCNISPHTTDVLTELLQVFRI